MTQFQPTLPGAIDPRIETLLQQQQAGHPATQGTAMQDGRDLQNTNMFQRTLAAGMNNDGGFGDKMRSSISNMTPLLLEALAKYKAQKAGGIGGAPVPTAGGSPMPGYGGDNEQAEAPVPQQPMPGYGQQSDPQLAAILAQLGKGGMLS